MSVVSRLIAENINDDWYMVLNNFFCRSVFISFFFSSMLYVI